MDMESDAEISGQNKLNDGPPTPGRTKANLLKREWALFWQNIADEDVNERDEIGFAPLDYAAYDGDYGNVVKLLKHGARVHTNRGLSPPPKYMLN